MIVYTRDEYKGQSFSSFYTCQNQRGIHSFHELYETRFIVNWTESNIQKGTSSMSSHTCASTFVHISIASSFFELSTNSRSSRFRIRVRRNFARSFIYRCDHVTRSCGFPCHFNSLRHAEWNCRLYLLSCNFA